jgi:hypothetical protein
MNKRSVMHAVLGSVMLLGMAVGPAAPAMAQEFPESEIMYHRTYYSDASHTTEVGYEDDTCHYYGKGGGQTHGIETAYYDSDPIAYCHNGQLYPY